MASLNAPHYASYLLDKLYSTSAVPWPSTPCCDYGLAKLFDAKLPADWSPDS